MKFQTKNLRKRFDQMRQAMRWSWKDIDAITGRKNARTNINKRVPAWSHLAIQTHEYYEVLIRHHIIETIALYLGREWSLRRLGDDFYFLRDRSDTKKVAGINLKFYPGGFELMADTSTLYEVAERLKFLYPSISDVKEHDEGYILRVPILFDADPDETVKRLIARINSKF